MVVKGYGVDWLLRAIGSIWLLRVMGLTDPFVLYFSSSETSYVRSYILHWSACEDEWE